MSTPLPGNGTSLQPAVGPDRGLSPDVPDPGAGRVDDATCAEGTAGDDTGAMLATLCEQVVALLAALPRSPHSLRARSGSVELDIAWASPAQALTVPSGLGGGIGGEIPPAGSTTEPAIARTYLTSPGVGVFYHAPEPGAQPFVSVGSVVRPGQQIGIIEAMKLMVPVEADRLGRICEVLKGNGEPVQYAEPLFALEPEES